jgi:hypothetical protein
VNIEWFVPPQQPHKEIDHCKRKRRNLQLADGQSLCHAGDYLHNEPQSLEQGDALGKGVALALVDDVFAWRFLDAAEILLGELRQSCDRLPRLARYESTHTEEEPVRQRDTGITYDIQ